MGSTISEGEGGWASRSSDQAEPLSGRGSHQAAVPALPTAKPLHRVAKLRLAELRPHALEEAELRVRALPEQEVAQPVLATGADQQIDIAGRPRIAVRRAEQRRELITIRKRRRI